MNCVFVYVQDELDGRLRYRCEHCGVEVRLRREVDAASLLSNCDGLRKNRKPSAPAEGPGTELREVIKDLGLSEKPGCGCAAMQARMNRLGVAGCSERRDELASYLRKNAGKFGLGDKARAAMAAIQSGLALRIDWTDPYPGLIDEAIRLAQFREGELLASIDLAPINLLDRRRIDPATLLPSPHQFNCSLIRFRGRLLLAYRVGWFDSYLALAELDEQFNVRSNWRIPLRSGEAQEDPRLFVFRGELHVSFTVPKREGQRHVGSKIGYARLKHGDWTVDGEWVLPSPLNAAWEKNWGFFEHDEHLHAVYSIRPHRIVRIDGSRAMFVAATDCDFGGKLGLLHGGAAPLLHQGEFYSFYHRIVGNGENRRYTIDLYTFEAKPPFRPSRQIFASLLAATDEHRPKPTIPHAVFPGGAVRDGLGSWFVGFGYYDKWSEIARWNEWHLEHALEPLPGGPFDGIACNTDDFGLHVWKQVALGNEYHLPEDMTGQVVVDVGGHIGSFAYACLTRGAARVVTIEPLARSRECAEKNLARFGDRVEIVPAYVVGRLDDDLPSQYAMPMQPDPTAPIRTLDSILDSIPPVDLLKLDCEGPEHMIIAASDLSRVQRIVGECHQIRCSDMASLATALQLKGFAVESHESGSGLWDFWATRTPQSNSPS